MVRIDLHKLALTVGFEVVCVDEDYTNYEYMVRLRDIESMSYILKIKNDITFLDVDNILQSIVIVLPAPLKRKIKRLTRNSKSFLYAKKKKSKVFTLDRSVYPKSEKLFSRVSNTLVV